MKRIMFAALAAGALMLSPAQASCNLAMHQQVSPINVPAGQTVTITLVVTGVGNAACQPGPFPGTILRDNQPVGLHFVNQNPVIVQSGGSANWQCGWEVPSNNLTCATPQPLPIGYNATFTSHATVTGPSNTNITNCGIVTNQNDPHIPNNTHCKIIHVQ